MNELILLGQNEPPYKNSDKLVDDLVSAEGKFIVVEPSANELVDAFLVKNAFGHGPHITMHMDEVGKEAAQDLKEQLEIRQKRDIGFDRNDLFTENIDLTIVKNPWIEEGKTPPEVKMMRILLASASVPENSAYQFHHARGFCTERYNSTWRCDTCNYCQRRRARSSDDCDSDSDSLLESDVVPT